MSGDLKVWEERRSRVGTIIEEFVPLVKNVLDLGCGDGKLFQLLKFNRQFKDFHGIDQDWSEVENSESRVGPEMDHVFQPVDEEDSPPLTVAMFQGDITRPSKNRQRHYDAITLVEVIEHLFEDELEALPAVLFNHYKARVIIITTPNSDYNQCIRGFKGTSYGGFRHPDHKFEWSRREFEEWSWKQCRKYGFKVRFETVGRVNPDDEEDFFNVEKHGRCTQIGVFEPIKGFQMDPAEEEKIQYGTLEKVVQVRFPSFKKKENRERSSRRWPQLRSSYPERYNSELPLWEKSTPSQSPTASTTSSGSLNTYATHTSRNKKRTSRVRRWFTKKTRRKPMKEKNFTEARLPRTYKSVVS